LEIRLHILEIMIKSKHEKICKRNDGNDDAEPQAELAFAV
jgi:hypothetical protein